MPRIKLVEQKTYEFRSSIDVQPRDINYGGHLGNDTLVSIVGAARARMFLSIGLSELDLGDGRTGVVMSDLVVNYRSEAFLFDELLVETHVDEFTRAGFRLFHRLRLRFEEDRAGSQRIRRSRRQTEVTGESLGEPPRPS